MSARKLGVAVVWVILMSGASASAQVAVEVELVPDRPGPYYTGESLTIDVWLHSRFAHDVLLRLVQLDFSDTDPAIELDDAFAFNEAIMGDGQKVWMTVQPDLPVPWVYQSNFLLCFAGACVEFLADASVRLGAIEVVIPAVPGDYTVDLANEAEPAVFPQAGVRLEWEAHGPLFNGSGHWTAFDGEIVGGAIALTVVTQPIPATSTWGGVALLLGVLIVGSIVFRIPSGGAAVGNIRGPFRRIL